MTIVDRAIRRIGLLFKARRVRAYTTRDGVFVPEHKDKRDPARPNPKPTHDDSQLNIFGVLDTPAADRTSTRRGIRAKELQQRTLLSEPEEKPEEIPTEPEPSKDDADPETPDQEEKKPGIEYQQDWSAIEQHLPAFGAQPGWTANKRKKANEEAIAILHRGGKLSAKDRAKLAAYSGQGGIGDSLNEYYTPPVVAAAMWQILRNLGLTHGHVLEPSAGSGVFQETKPAGIQMTAVEWDQTSSAINRLLHPDDAVHTMPFEQHVTADPTKYDAVIGNVPFGVRGAIAAQDKQELTTAEEYFVDTCLDKTKDGGVVCLVVPHGIATNPTSRSYRQRILKKAEVLGVHRLPNTAFKHSGTGVVTDILVLRKRPQEVAGALEVIENRKDLDALGVWDQSWMDGKILEEDGRGFLHGTAQTNWRGGLDVAGDMDGVPEKIATMPLRQGGTGPASLSDLSVHFADDPDMLKRLNGASVKNPYPMLPTGTTKLVNGVLYVLQGEPRRWHLASEWQDTLTYEEGSKEATALDLAERIKSATEFADRGTPVNTASLKQEVLDFADQYGNPAQDKALSALARRDPRFFPLLAALDEQGRPSALLEGTLRAKKTDGLDTTDFDAVMKHLLRGDGRTVTVDQIANTWDGDKDDILPKLYASDRYAVMLDGVNWGLREDFLSGELYPRRDAIQAALPSIADPALKRKMEEEVQWLDDALAPKTLEEFEVSLRSGWVPTEVLAGFLTSKMHTYGEGRIPGYVTVEFKDGVYHISKTGSAFLDGIYDKYLNRLTMREKDWERIPELEQEFKDWIATSPHRADIEDRYNRLYNGYRPKRFGDQPVDLPGWNPDRTLNAYQHPALRWGAEEGKGIISYDVGVGKTPYAIALVKMMRVQGKARRPVIVVPKSLTANWAAEIEAFAPGSKVLIIGETHTRGKNGKLTAKSDGPEERYKKWHQVAQGDFDYILVTQPAYNEITLNPIKRGEYVNTDFWVTRGKQLDEATPRHVREIQEKYNQAMATKDFEKRTNVIYWDDLGVDLLIADEGHNFKNLFTARSRFGEQPKYLGGSGFAKRALDMQHKARFVREHNNGRGVFFLSATPTKNSPLEVYSMLSHVAPELFEQRGIRNSEEFIDRYCEISNMPILQTDGTIAPSPVVTGFKNMNELRSIMGRYIYRKTAADVGLKIPEKDIREHYIDMTPEQQSAYALFREQMQDADSKSAGEAHIFSIMDKMAKAAMDLELLDPKDYKGSRSPKYEEAVKNIVEGLKDGGQVVFADHIDVHQKLKGLLVKAGIPEDQIGIINADEAKDSAKRQNIADDYVNGKIKVVIGNTTTMGEGVNLQKFTSDIHHLDIPWDPASVQQRNGRGVRQGNKLASVRIHTYLAKKSFDGYRYQTVAGKRDWMDQLWHGEDRLQNLAAQQGTLSRDDFMVMMADDTEQARQHLESNKAVQMERYHAAKKAQAIGQFQIWQNLTKTYAALENKQSRTAIMLAMRIDRIKHQLQNDEHFSHKALLDGTRDTLLTPSGVPLYTGAAVKMKESPDSSIKFKGEADHWVVTGLDTSKATVTMRPVGVVPSGYSEQSEYTFPIVDLKSGVESADPITPHEELKRVLPQVRKPSHLAHFDPAVIDQHEPDIQAHLREQMAKERDFSSPYDEQQEALWAIGPGGYPRKVFPGGKDAKESTYILPTRRSAKELIKRAYDEKRRATLYGRGSRKRSSSDYYYRGALSDVFGWKRATELLQAYEEEQRNQPVMKSWGFVFGKSFAGHRGRPGLRGGSLPQRGANEGRNPDWRPSRYSEEEEKIQAAWRDTIKGIKVQKITLEETEKRMRFNLQARRVSPQKIEETVDLLHRKWKELFTKSVGWDGLTPYPEGMTGAPLEEVHSTPPRVGLRFHVR